MSGAGGARDASTDKFVTIRGRLALGDHTAGLETNKIGETDSSVSGAELFSFGLVPTGESATATQLVINLSDVQGFGATDFSNLIVYRDDNSKYPEYFITLLRLISSSFLSFMVYLSIS